MMCVCLWMAVRSDGGCRGGGGGGGEKGDCQHRYVHRSGFLNSSVKAIKYFPVF